MYSKESIFRRPQLSELFGVGEETIRRDIDKSFITPKQRGGKGRAHLFVWDDLIRIALFYKLRKCGFQLNIAANLTNLIKQIDPHWYEIEYEEKDLLVFYTDEPQAVAAYSREELILKPIRDAAFIIDTKKLINELETKIKKL